MTPKVLLALAAAAISLSLNALAADPQLYHRHEFDRVTSS